MSLFDRVPAAEPEAEQDARDEFDVSASDVERLTEQVAELGAKRKELTLVQDDTESELRDLRAAVALGRASAGDEMRRETLLDRSNQQAGELRELTRLIRLTDKGLSRAKSLQKYEQEKADSVRAAVIAQRAKEQLDKAERAVLKSGARYLALWGLANQEKAYFTSRKERITHSIDPKELELKVTQLMEDLAQELLYGPV